MPLLEFLASSWMQPPPHTHTHTHVMILGGFLRQTLLEMSDDTKGANLIFLAEEQQQHKKVHFFLILSNKDFLLMLKDLDY